MRFNATSFKTTAKQVHTGLVITSQISLSRRLEVEIVHHEIFRGLGEIWGTLVVPVVRFTGWEVDEIGNQLTRVERGWGMMPDDHVTVVEDLRNGLVAWHMLFAPRADESQRELADLIAGNSIEPL